MKDLAFFGPEMFEKREVEIPVHPGRVFRKIVKFDDAMTLAEEEALIRGASEKLGVPYRLVEKLTHEEVAVDEDLAKKLGDAYGPSPEAWLELQRRFDEVMMNIPLVKFALENRAVVMIPFYWAPKELQELSPHGGDEDWIAIVPDEVENHYYPGVYNTEWFGSSVSCHSITGAEIYIGAHS